ncbi:MAG: 30S ribosomal protein S9 [Enterobacteriaceae bacterium]|nr:30S ribosomal protein S9 [Enterobacteriaceae bacterium]
MNISDFFYSTGKRKTSIARVFLKTNGTGIIKINDSESYYNDQKIINIIKKPLQLLDIINNVDLKITVKGGGPIGQAEAIRHGISKAVLKLDNLNSEEERTYRQKLKKVGFLTRDSRIVERKKVGRRKARKKEQYSKR